MDLDESEIRASYSDKFVCADCFDDDHLKSFIEDAVVSRTCGYCGKRSLRKNIAAPVDSVVEHMFGSIRRRYGEAWASGCSWDNEDDRYLNETWNTGEILQNHVDLPKDHSGALYRDILDAFPSWDWSSTDPWSPTDAEILNWAWERFVDAVKYRRRFFFRRLEEDGRKRDREDLDPAALLERFGLRCAQDGLIATIPKGTMILRCRPREHRAQTFNKARELGPPPCRFAKQNRMSPAGIPMFYGSDDERTTLAEVPELPKHYALGTFETLRPLRVLDLTRVRPPSIFDMSEEADFDWLIFLREFLLDFSSPIERDDRIHIDYVPIQVVTEYLRDAKLEGDPPLDGIKYRSSRRKGGICYVLFIDEYGVEPKDGDLTANDAEDERWRMPKDGYALGLRNVSHYTRRK